MRIIKGIPKFTFSKKNKVPLNLRIQWHFIFEKILYVDVILI